MTAWKEHRGIIIFGIIAIIVLAGALIAFKITGPMGIEDRFHAATGIIPVEEEDAESGIAGFFLEGNALLYFLILAGLIVVCVFAYRQFRI
jgi:hypothetical protein